MAAKLSNKLFRGGGRNALDLPVAGLSALAAAFAAFALPQDLLNRAVVATGLPSILSAAQPPLGLTARVAIAVGSAALVFGIVFLALRLLDRSGLGSPEAGEESHAGPRVRRRDGHPDAPAPRPISAARDLGEPAPPRAPRAEVPLWLDEAVPTPPAFGATVEFEPVLESVPELEPESDVLSEPKAEAEPWQAPEPIVFPEPAPLPEPEPEPVPTLQIQPEPEPAPEPEPVPVAVAAPVPAPEPAPAPAPSPALQAEMPTSIAGLMERLEQGLARRRTIEPAPAPAEPEPAAPPQVFPDVPEVAAAPIAPEMPQVFPEAPEAPEPEPVEAANDRLQLAIASLQQLAARSA
jgi:hypothetical protein